MGYRLPDPVVTSIKINTNISQEELKRRKKDFVSVVASIVISGIERNINDNQRKRGENIEK